MASRLAARLLTGPLAFFLAGLLDIVSYLLGALGRRLRRHALTPSGGPSGRAGRAPRRPQRPSP